MDYQDIKQQVKLEEEEKKNRFYKEIILGVSLAFAGVLLGWAWSHLAYLESSRLLDLGQSGYYFLAIVLYIAVFSVYALLSATWWLAVLSVFVSLLGVYLFFPFKNVFVWGLAGGTALILWSYYAIRSEYNAAAKVYFTKVVGRKIGIFLTGLSFVFSVIYFGNFSDNTDPVSMILPKPLFIQIAEKLENPIQRFMPGFKVSDTIDDFFTRSIKDALASQGVHASDSVIRAAVKEQRDSYAQDLGFKLNGTEKVVDVMYKFIYQTTNTALVPFKEYLPLIFSVFFFLVIRGAAFIFYYLSLLISLLVIMALRVYGFITMRTIEVKKEIWNL